ncbi:N-glycosylase/DNA lyase OGG1 isoform X4 [Jatropha curcas]|uniref:N-glycosylase/DNA lyase OGG1 isoform X2 n=1 Tax=Jatropha curcas TaxID=180498 RepID=UPI0009D65E24|nr:N-glycosylase/DNA lyase OGG1 isoform X2 [Jatropha curcas]XP_037491887.1 N-glycosylase/DNA lyase OGG1 isoform X4 [Jatropha curcas]
MKRQRPQVPLSTTAKSPLLPPPTPPQTLLKSRTTTTTTIQISSKKSKRTILKPTTTAAVGKTTISSTNWAPLGLIQAELFLPLTFPTGQTFRWKQTGPFQYTGTLGPHLISLKNHHENGNVYYHIHRSPSESAAKSALLDFLNIDISLTDMWAEFSVSDSRFSELARHLQGARVLRQDPLECLIQFLCSSNNNIARITKMVDFISSLGEHLGNVEGFDFHEFPSLERLAMITEQQLREAGFGYRAKYITGTVDALQSKPGGGAEWLSSLRKSDLQVVVDALCTLPGVGPKVASCIALFSLDQHHAIPVDTHVWQIATRYLLPELAAVRLTPKLCSRVADAFVSKYGKYAGWAQTLLFIAELPSQKTLLPSHFWTINEKKSATKKEP